MSDTRTKSTRSARRRGGEWIQSSEGTSNHTEEIDNNAEVPIAISSIKFESELDGDNGIQEQIQIQDIQGDNANIIHTGEDIEIEEAELTESNQVIDGDLEKQLDIIEGHNAELVKIVPLPHARSEVWAYFGFIANSEGTIIDRTKVVCKLCTSIFCYSGNTTNFYSHLKSMHSEVSVSMPYKSKSGKRQYSDDDQGYSPSTSYARLDDDSMPERSSEDSLYVEDITAQIVDFLVTDCRPLCVVQGKGFQRLMRLLAPGYSLPDRTKLSVAVRKRYDEIRTSSNAVDKLTN